MEANTWDDKHRSLTRMFKWPILTVMCGAAVWLLFSYVISDAELALDYLRTLAWPLVVVASLYWLRAPVKEKLRELLRVDAFGASAEFSPEAQGRRLDSELRGDLSTLLDGPDDHGESSMDHAGERPGSEVADGESLGPAENEPVAGVDQQVSVPPKAESALSGGVSERDAGPEVNQNHLHDLLEVARMLGVSDKVLRAVDADLTQPDEARKRLLEAVTVQAQRHRAIRNQGFHRLEHTRESLESVIRKSAAWGYEMGRAGAPKAVPEVEWGVDGTWHIITEIPKGSPKAPAEASTVSHRHIKALEDEIKKLERANHSPFVTSSLTRMSDESWLKDLKQRLRRIDPGNPWAMP